MNYRFPAEWEPQRAVLLTWPHAGTDWQPYLGDITAVYLRLADEITRRECLVVATPHPVSVGAALARVLTPQQMARVNITHCPTNDTWARDHGPITLVPDDPARPLRLLDFHFNGWGGKFPAELDNAVSSTLCKEEAFGERTVLVDNDDLTLEGGAIESDGRGTVLTTHACLAAPGRNEGMTDDELDDELCHRLRVRRVVRLHHGTLEGDDTDGHIDTIVRFAPDDTILYTRCDRPDDQHYAPFMALEQELRTLRTLDDRPYRLLPLPLPRPIYDGDDRLPATYANFLVINGAVLLPTYAQPDLDRQAADVLQQAFPCRDIVTIDARTVIRQHGSLHCCAMQIPS